MATPAVLMDAVDQLDGIGTTTKSPDAAELLKAGPQHDDDFDVFTANAKSFDKKEESMSTEQMTTTTTSLADNSDTSKVATEPTVISNNNSNTTRRYVTPKDFELLKVIGMGAFGKVLQVRNKKSQQILAMKVISKRLLRKKGVGMIENITAERNILTKLLAPGRHPFVVSMHCSFQSREKLFIIMDFLAGGELFLRLGREGIFLEKNAAFYLGEIILAIDHLHACGILHRDLKPENILLGSDGHVCLTDFGLAKDFGTGLNNGDDNDDDAPRALTICGTQEYMSPEMIARKGYGRASDYWSLGCIAYEMLSGRPPFDSKQGAKVLFRKIMTEKIKMPEGSSAAACKLLKGLLNRNVQARLGTARSTMFEVGGVAGLKKVEFFAHIDWDKLEQKQIEPPAVFSVDHEGDVQHFHEEFTSMALPRSVHEMSMDDFKPRRVQSEAFRGFSFIQDDFVLPDRDALEVRSYWDSVEEDGESVSECASSKFEAELDASPPIQDKKKRPPRKRKKKNARDITGSALSTPAGTAANTPEPSESGHIDEELPKESKAKQPVDQATVSMATCTISQEAETTKPVAAQPVPSTSARRVVPPTSSQEAETAKPAAAQPLPITPARGIAPLPKSKPQTWQKASKKSPARSDTVQNKPQKQQQLPANGFHNLYFKKGVAQQSSWTAASPKRQAPGQFPQNNWTTSSPSQKQQYHLSQGSRPIGGSREVPGPSQPKWSGWSSAASPHRKKPAASNDASPASPSSDWRQHPMSPRDGRPALNKFPSGGQTTTSWPSLGGPPLSSSKPKTPKLQGAWASKS